MSQGLLALLVIFVICESGFAAVGAILLGTRRERMSRTWAMTYARIVLVDVTGIIALKYRPKFAVPASHGYYALILGGLFVGTVLVLWSVVRLLLGGE